MNPFFTHFQTPFIQIENYNLDEKIVNLIPFHTAEQHQMLAIDKTGNILTLGITHEHEKEMIPHFEKMFNCKILPIIISLESWLEKFPTTYNIKTDELQINYIR